MEGIGIDIKLMLDDAALDRNVDKLNKDIRLLKKEVGYLNKELKLDPKNIENLNRKFENLRAQEQLARKALQIYKEDLRNLQNQGIISGDAVDQAILGAEKMQGELSNIQRQMQKCQDLIDEQSNGWNIAADALGKASQKAGELADKLAPVSKAAQNFLGGAVQSAIDFQDAFADVRKTVDETSTTTYDDLSNGLRNLAKEVPVTADELSHIAGLAGQMGVKADDIVTFTEAMVKFGDSTNITAEEATQDIAQIYNVIGKGGDFSSLNSLLSTIVDLGNNTATTEKDIVEMYRNIAAGASRVGMNEQQMAALAATLSSLGLDKGGASAISKVMTNIDKAVDGNTKMLTEWANVAGMSAEEFSQLWNTDASSGLLTVVQGIARMNEEGISMNNTLEDLGVKEIRQVDTLSRLTNANDEYAKNIDLANKAYDEGSALNEEAAKRYKTVASQIKILKNNFMEFSLAIGEIMLPYVDWLVQSFKEIADWLNNLEPHTKLLITRILAIVAVLAPLLLGASKMLGFLKLLITNVGLISNGVKILFSAVSSLWGFLLPIIQGIGAFIASHALWIGIIFALGVAFKALYDNCQPFREFVDNLIQAVKNLWDQFMQTNWIEALGEKFGWIGEVIGLVVEAVKTLFGWMGKLIDKVFEFLGLKGGIEEGIGNLGGNVRGITALETSGMNSGGMMSGSITLNNSFTVTTNNVTEEVVKRWANTITNQVNENLGRMYHVS